MISFYLDTRVKRTDRFDIQVGNLVNNKIIGYRCFLKIFFWNQPSKRLGCFIRKLAPNYFHFNQKWIKLMRFIEKDKVFRKYLNSRWL